MSLQELHVKALEHQVQDLTRDCYYLLSLLNCSGEIDWKNWPQGQKIKEHLERSKDFFETVEQRRTREQELDRMRKQEVKIPMRERCRAARIAAEELKRREAKKLEETMPRRDYPTNDLVNRQHLRPRDVYWTWPVQRQEELEREARNEQRLAEERERNIKLGSVWNRKKLDNVFFGHASTEDLQKLLDYIFDKNNRF